MKTKYKKDEDKMIHNLLKDKKVILASASPRRKKIFELLSVKALQMPANIKEEQSYKNPRKLVLHHAKNKVRHIRSQVDNDYLIIGADTIVYHKKDILEKPRDRYQAAEYLTLLSSSHHYVYSGIAIAYKNQIVSDYEKTKVFFNEICPEDIAEYVNTQEPMDKAGAYGIQGFGSQFIQKISGCYFNVMGFPISKFYILLLNMLKADQ